MKIFIRLIIATGLITAMPALAWSQAAGPYIVDNAAIVEKGTLQNENWYTQTSDDQYQGAADLAYQILPHFELTLQAMHDDDQGDHTDYLSPQFKYQLIGDDAEDIIQAGLVAGDVYALDDGSNYNVYSYVPVTLRLEKKLFLNVNLGWQYAEDRKRNLGMWGSGLEYRPTDAWSFIGELFGRTTEQPGLQAGPHYKISDQVELDLIYGHHVIGMSGDAVTAGLTFDFN